MTAARNLILPSSSRVYVINNNTTGGFALTVKGSATSGVTMVNGESAHIYWNGSDYAKAANTAGVATFTNLTYTGTLTGSTGVIAIGTNQIYKDSSGNVGIGTASPSTYVSSGGLALAGTYGTSNAAVSIYNTSGSSASNIAKIDFRLNNTFLSSTPSAAIWALNPNAAGNNGGALVFATSANGTSTTPTEAVRIDQAGNVGIATSSPATGPRLTVQGGGGNSYGGIRLLSDTLYSNGANYVAYGRRGDSNPSGAFAPGVLLARVNTAPAALISGINLGRVAFGGSYDGTDANVVYGAQIAGYSSGTYSSTSAATDLLFFTTPSGTAGGTTTGTADFGTERMRIDSSGNVGIGTSSPTAKLDVLGGNARVALATGSSTTLRGYEIATGTTVVASLKSEPNSGELRLESGFSGYGGFQTFYCNGSEAARITSGGSLLVGTTTPTTAPAVGCQLLNGSLGQIAIGHDTSAVSGNFYASFAYNSGVIGTITQSGTTAVLYNVTSDQRLKENIQDADSASALIDSLQVRKFDWKTDNTHQRYGFVAQELVTVAPEAVHQPVNEDDMMAVDYSKLVPMLVKEIQSLRKRLTALEST
jgi:hypothetical protein